MKPQKPTTQNPDNLYQRKGYWWIRYSTNGKKIRRSLKTKSVRQAKRLRDQILAKRCVEAKFGIQTTTVEPIKTFEEIARKWIATRQANLSLALSTRKVSIRVVKNLLIPEFGHMLMNTITVEDVEQFIAKLQRKHKRSTVAGYYRVFVLVFRHAIKRGWYHGPNPIDKLEHVPTHGPGRTTTLTVNEAKRLLQELDGRIYYKSALALYTGLRWGEVHGLAWSDVNLTSNPATLTVQRSYQGKPKNQASAATIPLSNDAVALLQEWRAQQKPPSLWVFPSKYKTLATQRNLIEAQTIHNATKKAGIGKHVTPHVFRHTFGTWVYEQTQDPKTVQRLMRHGSFNTSMGYVHDRRELDPIVQKLPTITKPRRRK